MNPVAGNSISAEKPNIEYEKLLTLEEYEEENVTISTNTWAILGFIAYLILGLLFFCYSDTKLSALDAVYLSIVTFTTVGYGMNFPVAYHLLLLL
jgi:VanZ family protein